jgi:hypothetical protein
MQAIKDVFCDQPGRPKPVLTPEAPRPVVVTERSADLQVGMEAEQKQKSASPRTRTAALSGDRALPSSTAGSMAGIRAASAPDEPSPSPAVSDVGQGAAKLLEAGLSFLASLAPPRTGAVSPRDRSAAIERALSSLLRTDAQTQRPVLTIPLPESFSAERLTGIVGGLLSKFAGSS